MPSNTSDQTGRELTLTDIIVAIRRFVREALRKWWLFGLLFLVIGGFLIYKAYTEVPTYQARFTFMVNEDDGGGLSGVASILGQFGIGNRRGRYNLDKILELSRSRRIIQETVFAKTEINGSEDYLSNHMLDIYEMVEKWTDAIPEFEGFRFSRDSVQIFDDLERTALLRVYRKLVGSENKEGLVASSFSDQSSILTISARTIDEELSLAIVNNLFESLSGFYVDQSTERQQATYDIIKAKVDSVAAALASAEMSYARFRDANQNLLLRADRVREGELSREITKLNLIHGEGLKNLELADFALKNATPFIQEIDRPIPPLKQETSSLFKAAFIGAFLALLIGSIWIIGKMVSAQLLQQEFSNNE